VEERDRKAIARTTSGLVKLIHPDGQCTKEEVQEYLTFATEMRRRVKEQLKRMVASSILASIFRFWTRRLAAKHRELPRARIDATDSRDEPQPRDLFTVGFDSEDARYSLTVSKSQRHLLATDLTSLRLWQGCRESARMAYDSSRPTHPALASIETSPGTTSICRS